MQQQAHHLSFPFLNGLFQGSIPEFLVSLIDVGAVSQRECIIRGELFTAQSSGGKRIIEFLPMCQQLFDHVQMIGPDGIADGVPPSSSPLNATFAPCMSRK